ncbi:transposase [Chryseobacterium sp. PMSZPI]|uniref:transposase n=1 Tax=Chryseobacterium sp. PMSZPI TaxID=1033900 RepID=UPI0039A0594C
MNNIKNIHIGKLIEERWKEMNISIGRTSNFFGSDTVEVLEMFTERSLDCELLLKWSKLLEYDFFRLYSQHLILYAPPGSVNSKENIQVKTSLPQFRKSLYTKQMIDFILELISTGEKTKYQVIEEYKIPKTTLYTWIKKYSKVNE